MALKKILQAKIFRQVLHQKQHHMFPYFSMKDKMPIKWKAMIFFSQELLPRELKNMHLFQVANNQTNLIRKEIIKRLTGC